jgi:hypothetical protein
MTTPIANDEHENTDMRLLQDHEVDAVSGGLAVNALPAVRTYGPIDND